MQWVFPIAEPTQKHRRIVAAICVCLSALIWWQQQAARQEHVRELGNLTTKDDLKKLPTASEIVGEFKRVAPAGVNQKPWGLTDEQLAKLTERISIYAAFSPEKGDLITAVMGDTDSMRFGSRLAIAFTNAHWKGFKGGDISQAMYSQPFEGVVFHIRDKGDRPPGLEEIIQTFKEAGIPVSGYIDPQAPKDEFRINNGLRPPN